MSCLASDGPDLSSLPIPAKDREGNDIKPSWHMRERLAAAISFSRPSYHGKVPLEHAYGHFLFHRSSTRELHEMWADELLRVLEHVGLSIEDRLDGQLEETRGK